MLKAEVAIVKIGCLEFEGLMLEDGSEKPNFAIAQQQIAVIFQVIPESAPKWLKRLLPIGSSLFSVKTNREKVEGKRVRSSEKALLLPDFEKVLRKLDREGNAIAQDLVDALVGLALHQLFSDAFGVKFEEDDRQQWLNDRMSGIKARKTFTDSIKEQYLDTHPDVDKVPFYAYSNPSDALNRLLTGHPAKYWKEKFGLETDEQLRNHWGSPHLARIEAVEKLAQAKMEHEDLDSVTAIKEAIAAFHFQIWTEDELLGDQDKKTYWRNYRRNERAKKAAK